MAVRLASVPFRARVIESLSLITVTFADEFVPDESRLSDASAEHDQLSPAPVIEALSVRLAMKGVALETAYAALAKSVPFLCQVMFRESETALGLMGVALQESMEVAFGEEGEMAIAAIEGGRAET